MNTFDVVNPVAVTKRVAGLAGTAVGVTVGVTKGAIHGAGAAAGIAGSVVRGTAHVLRPDPSADAVSDVAVPPEPAVVQPEPHVPDGPPVDVVGETLAREAAAERGEGPQGAGLAHEPRGASRDEEHGDAALQRAEAEEIAEETTAALEGDVEP